MLASYKRELHAYLTSAIGYAFIALFFAVSGGVFVYTTLYSGTASPGNYYSYMLIFFVLLLPILPMKSFSEERKLRTEQLLMTAPVSIVSMVTAKFLAAMTIFVSCMALCSCSFILLARYATVRAAMVFGNLIAILLVGGAFIAIGLFVSALTENQLAAAIGTVGIILLFFAVSALNSFIPVYWIRFVLSGVSIFSRFGNFTQGAFDFSALLYYLSVMFVFLLLTGRVYDRRRYR
ncbi:MAG: ABC transporter [Clostridia bacterium]|nr:ABC transporter [Clostridia bacterium]